MSNCGSQEKKSARNNIIIATNSNGKHKQNRY